VAIAAPYRWQNRGMSDYFGAPIAEENDGEIVPGWWTD
jgi:hypothetical protein